tara:strand:+ start:25 stop:1566 length:1542 start_codon:yes stop_codon:yes gene_type:complete
MVYQVCNRLDEVYSGYMTDLIITQIDSVHIKIDCERALARELNQFFTFTVPNYQFTPAYKNKTWDGQIRLYNLYKRTLYAGLLEYVIQFVKDRNYTYSCDIKHSHKKPSENDVDKFTNEHLLLSVNGKSIQPYNYQLDAIYHAIMNERCLLLSPTGSGKSLIIYCLMRYYLDILPKDKKILLIVPTTGLVTQMFSDIRDYSSKSSWSVDKNCHSIFSGQDKVTNKRVVISTWQSIYKMKDDYFEQFGVVFGDECHLYKAKSLTSLMSKLKSCPFRVGTTGTLDDSLTHKLVIEGLFGKVYNVTSTKELMEKDVLSNLEIECLTLKYTIGDIKEIKRAKYKEEIEWIVSNKKRSDFIVNLVKNIDGNTLILFNFVDSHGKPLYESIKESVSKDRKVFFIYGGTDVDQREQIRNIVDKEKNSILVASYGTCSTGINIRNINNIIFASPSKSVIRVLQSIGRGLRKSDNKENVKLYDISDDLSFKKYKNHTLKHLDERIKIYSREGFNYKSVTIKI